MNGPDGSVYLTATPNQALELAMANPGAEALLVAPLPKSISLTRP